MDSKDIRPNVKIVLFDAVGVLFPKNTVVGDDLAAQFNLSEAQLARMWKGFYPEYATGKLTTEQFLETFASTYNIPHEQVTTDVFTRSFLRALTPMPGMAAILRALQNTTITLAMLSDTSEMFADARRKWLFSEYFDHIFLSFEIGYRKPDARAFQAVLDYYHVTPAEVFFIDDNTENITAAQQLGMQTLHFENAEQLMRELIDAHILAE